KTNQRDEASGKGRDATASRPGFLSRAAQWLAAAAATAFDLRQLDALAGAAVKDAGGETAGADRDRLGLRSTAAVAVGARSATGVDTVGGSRATAAGGFARVGDAGGLQ